jgi:hypothetical protein
MRLEPVVASHADGMASYGKLCGWTLARAHARSGDSIAPAAYLAGARHVCIRAAQATG